MFDQEGKLIIYGNVLIETSSKFDFLKSTFPGWLAYWGCPAILRVRGKFAQASKEIFQDFDRVDLRLGTQFLTWRGQAFADLKEIGADFVFQYQEDHMVHPDAPASHRFKDAMYEFQTDVFQYSWFYSYSGLRETLCLEGEKKAGLVVAKKMDKRYLRTVVAREAVYPIGLTSIFRRTFYLRLLKSNRPFIKRFDPSGPFDVEQSNSSRFFAPFRLAFPLTEVGICIDDDHTVPGSSAGARGYYPRNNLPREFFHHSKTSLRSRVLGHQSRDEINWSRALVSKAISALDFARYSIEAPILQLRDQHKSSRGS